jgi:hypothetical protein
VIGQLPAAIEQGKPCTFQLLQDGFLGSTIPPATATSGCLFVDSPCMDQGFEKVRRVRIEFASSGL